MRSHREKVEFFNALKTALRADLAEARQAALTRPGEEASGVEVMERVTSQDVALIERHVRANRAPGCPQPSTALSLSSLEPVRTKLHSRDAVIRRESGLEKRLSGLADDAQLATVDLQKAIIRAHEHMRRVSQISKELLDIAMAMNEPQASPYLESPSLQWSLVVPGLLHSSVQRASPHSATE